MPDYFSTPFAMTPRALNLIFGILLATSGLALGKGQSKERIYNGSPYGDTSVKDIGAVVLKLANPEGYHYQPICTTALIGRRTMITSASCIRYALAQAKTDVLNEQRWPLVIIGMDNMTTEAIETEHGVVIINNVTEDSLTFHPHDNKRPNTPFDVVLLHLTNPIPEHAKEFLIMFVPYGETDDHAILGPYMLSWGQEECKGIQYTQENFVFAPQSDCDETTAKSNQYCVNLTSFEEEPFLPAYSTLADAGAPIFVFQNYGDETIYAIRGILSQPEKLTLPNNPDPNPFGTGCSKSSVVAATNILTSEIIDFLQTEAKKSGDFEPILIDREPIYDQ